MLEASDLGVTARAAVLELGVLEGAGAQFKI